MNPPLKIKIFDCFCFFNEFLLLKLRLEELKDVVDTFVIVESTKTLAGDPRELLLKDKLSEFESDKYEIIYLVFDDLKQKEIEARLPVRGDESCIIFCPDGWPLKGKVWNYLQVSLYDEERHHLMHKQRELFKEGVQGANDNDIVMFSDMDEIPSKHVVWSFREEELPAGLHLQQPYYYFNTPVVEPAGQACKYNGVLAYRYKQFKNLHLEKARIINCNRGDLSNTAIKWGEVGGTEKLKGVLRTIKNAGWSFTHLNTTNKIIAKLKSSSHIEYAHLAKDVARLKNSLENLVNIYDETIKLKQVKLDNTYPDYLRENQEEFKKFIYKTTYER